MHVNDPVCDMLTRIRNASRAHHDKVVIPSSKLKLQIAQVLRDQGFIADCVQHDRKPQAEMTLVLKYGQDRHPAISGIKRVSKPGLRKYVSVREIPQVLGGLGIAILSTSRGVMGDHQARQEKLGGELICTVY